MRVHEYAVHPDVTCFSCEAIVKYDRQTAARVRRETARRAADAAMNACPKEAQQFQLVIWEAAYTAAKPTTRRRTTG